MAVPVNLVAVGFIYEVKPDGVANKEEQKALKIKLISVICLGIIASAVLAASLFVLKASAIVITSTLVGSCVILAASIALIGYFSFKLSHLSIARKEALENFRKLPYDEFFKRYVQTGHFTLEEGVCLLYKHLRTCPDILKFLSLNRWQELFDSIELENELSTFQAKAQINTEIKQKLISQLDSASSFSSIHDLSEIPQILRDDDTVRFHLGLCLCRYFLKAPLNQRAESKAKEYYFVLKNFSDAIAVIDNDSARAYSELILNHLFDSYRGTNPLKIYKDYKILFNESLISTPLDYIPFIHQLIDRLSFEQVLEDIQGSEGLVFNPAFLGFSDPLSLKAESYIKSHAELFLKRGHQDFLIPFLNEPFKTQLLVIKDQCAILKRDHTNRLMQLDHELAFSIEQTESSTESALHQWKTIYNYDIRKTTYLRVKERFESLDAVVLTQESMLASLMVQLETCETDLRELNDLHLKLRLDIEPLEIKLERLRILSCHIDDYHFMQTIESQGRFKILETIQSLSTLLHEKEQLERLAPKGYLGLRKKADDLTRLNLKLESVLRLKRITSDGLYLKSISEIRSSVREKFELESVIKSMRHHKINRSGELINLIAEKERLLSRLSADIHQIRTTLFQKTAEKNLAKAEKEASQQLYTPLEDAFLIEERRLLAIQEEAIKQTKRLIDRRKLEAALELESRFHQAAISLND
jgi:hypothetical protein